MRAHASVYMLASLVIAAPAGATVTYISATRNVTSASGPNGTPQSFPSSALGPYAQNAASNATDPFGGPGGQTASGNGSHTSDLLIDSITYRMSASASDGISASSGSGISSGGASMIIRFSVDVDTPYALLGPSGSATGYSSFAQEQLKPVGGANLFNQFNSSSSGALLANLSGVLTPGIYEFTVTISAATNGTGSGTSFSSASINRQLALPTPSAAGALALGAAVVGGRRRRGAAQQITTR